MLRTAFQIPSVTALCALLSLGSLALAGGCASSTVINEAEPAAPEASPADMPAEGPSDASAAPPSGSVAPKDPIKDPGMPAEGDPKAPDNAKGSKADGDACNKADDCSSGVCEGEGCGPNQGKCAPKNRQCTLDLRPYCGCDGKTFQAGGNCPRARFSKKGACDGDPLPGLPAPKTLKKPG